MCQDSSKLGLQRLSDLLEDLNDKAIASKVNDYQTEFMKVPSNLNALRLIAL